MRYLISLSLILFFQVAIAQVGIGALKTSAHVSITSADGDIPALRLTPQATPVGTTGGQFAVIEDKLYVFDDSRSKWLSVEYTLFNFGLAGPVGNQELEYVGDIEQSGPRMPFDCTIVYITMNALSGKADKLIQIYKNNIPLINNDLLSSKDGILQMDNYSFVDSKYNLDFEAGDEIRIVALETGLVYDPSVLLKVKWRK